MAAAHMPAVISASSAPNGSSIRTRRARCGSGGVANHDQARISNPDQVEEGDQSANLIHVEITGLRNNRGQVYCQLFQSAEGFPSNAGGNAASTASTITNRRAECDFENEDSGSYADPGVSRRGQHPCARAEPERHSPRGRGTIEQPQGFFRTTGLRRGEVSLQNRQAGSDDQRELSVTQLADATRSFSPAPMRTPAWPDSRLWTAR